MIKIRLKNDPNAHAFEEEMLNAECSGDEEYGRKLEFLQETIGMLGFPVELDKEWIDVVKCRYRDPRGGETVPRPGSPYKCTIFDRIQNG